MNISEDFVINRQREQRYDPNRPQTDPSRKSVVGMHATANVKKTLLLLLITTCNKAKSDNKCAVWIVICFHDQPTNEHDQLQWCIATTKNINV